MIRKIDYMSAGMYCILKRLDERLFTQLNVLCAGILLTFIVAKRANRRRWMTFELR